ncbi:threonine/serine exporter ThrE family protein [Aeromicrobium sp. CTD01-1L150]|uniref:threonine/serine ThrE exporter family protein n=1 Tax=Aeromicrobium sp. CTD01-1L150 TaxID=3341830 RepID=UPI0035C25BFD
MTDVQDTQRTLDLALRIGEVLMSNGAGAADVTATMSSVCHHLGIRNALVDVTFTTLTLSHQPSVDDAAVTMRRHVTHREIDYADLTQVDLLVYELLAGGVDRDEAAAEIARISSTGRPYPRWLTTLSWGVTGAGVALLLGGDWVVLLVAAAAACGIEVLQRQLEKRRLPLFYSQVAGALLATMMAVGIAATPVPLNPSLVVSATIIMLLAGLGFVGSIQDALTGFYITANARVMEVMIATIGVIVGVSMGLGLGAMLGVDIQLDPGSAGLSRLPAVIAGAAICASGFAIAVYSPPRVILPVGAIAGSATGLSFVLTQNGMDRAPAAGVAAVGIGFVSYAIARAIRVPPLIVIVSCIVPMLPGLSIYRSLSLLADENITGVLPMITAGGVAIALSAGVLLGEYAAQPLGREARRLERRLSGPRLVGPLRARSRR